MTVYTLYRKETDEFIKNIEEQRKNQTNLQDKQVGLAISEEYLNELLKYDFQSSKKGRGKSSILLRKR